jgi:hypothetical protein
MHETGDLQQVGPRCFYRPAGVATAGELAHMIAAALSQARQRGMDQALVDIRSMSGFESPGPAFRRWAVGLWAEKAVDAVRVALLARAEHICPEKTGLLVAAEEGLRANIFEHERDALAWLDGESRGKVALGV